MTEWDPLFLIGGLIELIFGIVTLISPTFLFPGINSSGNLSSKWFAIAITSLGGYAVKVVGHLDGSDVKMDVAIFTLCYNLGIAVMTLIRLSRGMQVDGPNVTMNGCVNSSTQNVIKGILGVAIIHGSLVICCASYLSNFANGSNAIWAIGAPLFVLILTTCTSYYSDAVISNDPNANV